MTIKFLDDLDTGHPGQLGAGPHERVGSRRISTDAPAGVWVVPHIAGGCKLPTAEADLDGAFGGFLEHRGDREPNDNGLLYSANDLVGYIERGYITVLTEEAVSDQDPVFVRHTANGGNTQLGAARTDADTGNAFAVNARFIGDHTAGKALVKVYQ